MQWLGIQLVLAAAAAPTASAFDLMSAVLKSPIYKNLLVPASRNMMINTAKENGVPWADAVSWIRSAHKWELDAQDADVCVPAYYRQPFHAYEPGNLCWEAAWEAEVAGRAVGARNYPTFGAEGEEAFRGAFDDALVAAGARAPSTGETILDLGCATGHGTRRLAAKFPDAKALVGVDLSPYMLAAVWKSTSASGARQFFTKSFLGENAAVLAASSGEEPASPRRRAGVASMAWRSTRRFSTNAP